MISWNLSTFFSSKFEMFISLVFGIFLTFFFLKKTPLHLFFFQWFSFTIANQNYGSLSQCFKWHCLWKILHVYCMIHNVSLYYQWLSIFIHLTYVNHFSSMISWYFDNTCVFCISSYLFWLDKAINISWKLLVSFCSFFNFEWLINRLINW